MKKTILFSAIFLSSLAFAQKKEPAPGDGKDPHGCSVSAGYTYSKVRNECIRTWDQKVQLKEYKPKSSEKTMTTAVVFSKDMKKAELYTMDKEESMVLTKKGKETAWKNGDYMLIPVKKGYELRKKNVVIYK